jgi:hypothetical protein
LVFEFERGRLLALVHELGTPRRRWLRRIGVHPLVALTDALESVLDDAGGVSAWTMSPAELQAVLPRITRARNRLAEVELRVLRKADRNDVGEDVGATNTPAWWAHVTGQRIPAARAVAALAEQLDTGPRTHPVRARNRPGQHRAGQGDRGRRAGVARRCRPRSGRGRRDPPRCAG